MSAFQQPAVTPQFFQELPFLVSLEVLSFLITGPPPLPCILIYMPLKSVNFISEFTELLSIVIL